MAAPVRETDRLVDAGPCGWCGCAQFDHRLGKKGCKDPGCGCGKYEPPKVAPAVLVVDPVSPLPGVVVDGPAVPGPAERVGEPLPAQPGDVDLPIEFARPVGYASDIDQAERDALLGGPTLAAVEADPEPVDEPEPEPAPVVADPGAQAEHAAQVAAIDAQLDDRDRAEAPAAADLPMPPADFLAAVTMVGERAAAGYGWQEGYLAGRAALAAELAAARREANEALNRAGHYRAKRDTERRRADRLDADLRDVTAELERVRADKIRLAGQLAPRLADLDQALGEVARLRHVNVELGRTEAARQHLAQLLDKTAAELADERAEHLNAVGRLRTELDRANAGRQRAQDALDDAVRTGTAAAASVLFRYEADQCTAEGCGSRYTVPVEHEHPLTPVTVLVVRREVPGA